MLDVVTGIVLNTTEVKEADLMMTVYARGRGIISVYAKGVKSAKNKRSAACSELAYSEFTLFESVDKLWVRDATLIRLFFSPTCSVELLALSSYVREVLADVATAEDDEELMRLVLNTLHAIALEKYDTELLKAAFEIRLLSTIGFMPSVAECNSCGATDGEFLFDVVSGIVECLACHNEGEGIQRYGGEEGHPTAILTSGARMALEYCVRCPQEKLFSFNLGKEDKELFCKAAEAYIINQLERSFNSLEYYHRVKLPIKR